MNTITRIAASLVLFVSASIEARPWEDPTLDPDERARLLVAEMTLEEKVRMMHGVCRFEIPGCGYTIGKIPANERLGIPALHMTDGPAGVRNGQPATAFPAPVAVASSWNTELAREVAAAIGRESLARGQDVLLSPMINLVRAPLAGRNFETFGEDPYLLSRMAVAHIQGVQEQGVMANAKHYILNNQEWDRRRMTVSVDERTLRELYLPAFAASVREAEVASIMCSYNRVGGTHVCHHERLLNDILRGDLGFEGFVVTDWNALRDSDATPASAVAAGLNVVMPWPKGDVYGPPFEAGKPVPAPDGGVPESPLAAAVRKGLVDEARIDALVADTLREMFRFGLFERPDGPVGDLPVDRNRDLARRAAEQGAVLLKNADGALPLGSLKRLAVIGEGAFQATRGGGGSSAVQAIVDPVSPLSSLEAHFEANAVVSARGIQSQPGLVPVAETAWTHGEGLQGVSAEYFANPELAGEPLLLAVEPRIAFDWSRFPPRAALPADGWSARFSAMLTPPESGAYELDLVRAGSARAWLDGKPIFDERAGRHGGIGTWSYKTTLEAGRTYRVVVEYTDINQRRAQLKLGWRVPGRDLRVDLVDEAVAAARGADAALVFVGDPASEGRDRPGLSLGEDSDRLVRAVAAVNPRTVVVLGSGAPVAMPWIDEVEAVLLAWYPGQEGGEAVRNLLTGRANPSGRLPVTFGKRLEDYPANTPRRYPGVASQDAPDETWREAVYEEGIFVGYRHFDRARIEPLFPFGHGLSYTSFEWSDAWVEPNDDGSGWTVSVAVRNAGSEDGAEVIQLYVTPPGKAVERPVQELKAFGRVELQAGEQARVTLELPLSALAYWDDARGWVHESGKHGLLLGASSRDIRQRLELHVSP